MASQVGRALSALTVGLVLSIALPAAAQASGWRTRYQDGTVTVPANRSEIKICDGKADGRVYKATWAASWNCGHLKAAAPATAQSSAT
jgi:hypothetical protein